MTKIILEQITNIKDLLLFSRAYKEGLIKLNISKLSKELNKDRKTIKKYLNGEVPKETRKRVKYLDEHRKYILEVLTDKYQSFDYIDHLFKYLKREKNITCSRTSLNRYIRNDNELNKLFKRKKDMSFTERFETNPGIQAQFDMKEKVKLIDKNNNETVITIPTLTLSWSRYNVRKLILDTKTENLLEFLALSFEEIGGVPHELVIDNLKQFVEKPRYKDNEAIITNKLVEFAKDYNIKIKPCMPYRPQTKGKTETQNKIVDQLKNYNGKYKDIYEMHEKLEIIHKEDNDNISQATKLPRRFLLEKEKGDLSPLPRKEIRQKYHLSLKEVHVTNESLISYKSNKYSVPRKFIGLKVGLTVIKGNELHIYYKGKIITIHKITDKLLNIKDEHDLKYEKEIKTKERTTIINNEMRNIKYD
ncbi:IS21 family transposase [Haploplasma axanthum]|uniref:Transposase and inactivated derivatives n=2 Tax=Haploplasma axanthum TaxID=29552 RepID=A0A449BER1_HAPAX|nr:IS21 family transposase [Haploplasma axanthum]VEU80411.1 Transposase and inactivated derivatives [Haploplasma axanthum]VEU80915.1 Transposase and inactivated derivatives [Haploplasma axanthum]